MERREELWRKELMEAVRKSDHTFEEILCFIRGWSVSFFSVKISGSSHMRNRALNKCLYERKTIWTPVNSHQLRICAMLSHFLKNVLNLHWHKEKSRRFCNRIALQRSKCRCSHLRIAKIEHSAQ